MAGPHPVDDPRPLSPHLQIWRWHITLFTSIAHRASGIALYGGALLVAAWLFAATLGPGPFELVEGLIASPFGTLVLVGFTLALTYHLANGVRHLVWDVGIGFSPAAANASGWATLIFAALATAAVWILPAYLAI